MENLRGKRLIVRADANNEIGWGHLMRCLALARAWQDAGGQVTFITDCQSDGLRQRLREEGFGTHLLAHPYPHNSDWDRTKGILINHKTTWVVLDGYHFDEAYQQRIRDCGHRLLVIDDMAHLKHYFADIVLNQNLHAEQLHYSGEAYTHWLLGTRYVLLRREFLAWKNWKREITKVAQHVLVTMGGGDPKNSTLGVIQVLQDIDVPGLEAVVVVGASNPHLKLLKAATKQSRIPINLIEDARNMPELMAWADIAISAGGSTAWELAFMGLPAIFLPLTDNQRPITRSLASAGAALDLGYYSEATPVDIRKALVLFLSEKKVRVKMTQRGRQLVDGEGISRVMMSIAGARIRLRPVSEEDCRLLWEWANDPEVRAASFLSEPIPWEDHIRWFTQKNNDPNCFHFIALDKEDIPVGQVRFDMHGDEAEVSLSVIKERRGHEFGSSIIEAATERMFLTTSVKVVHAYIKPQNKASMDAFRKAGFQDKGFAKIRDNQAMHFIRVNNYTR